MSIDSAKKPRGRPPVSTEAINVRVTVEKIALIDDWRRHQPDLPTRAEAIRRLVDLALIGAEPWADGTPAAKRPIGSADFD